MFSGSIEKEHWAENTSSNPTSWLFYWHEFSAQYANKHLGLFLDITIAMTLNLSRNNN